MSFSHSQGTRGARQPGGRLTKWMNRRIARRIRTREGKVMGMNALVLTTIGRKSGEERSTPVGWFPGDDDSWLVVASAAGAAKNPAWYLNLAAHPDRLTIELAGKKIPVTATELRGEERSSAWKSITTASPRFAQYEEKTDRELPVIRLSRRI
ncbi:nitroreductase family deazaflavin-dependent oxidoreductase [Isoptericola hypogeus]|uniref:Nitroreductase family deazaflavin-dependent oxidoreductase n=1 Tax=Isoptericola hypogeus TaxID=300179 RepID=A0ABN2IND3_9MICO